MKKIILGLILSYFSIQGMAEPEVKLNFDVNNTTYLGDAVTSQGLPGALNNQVSKSEVSLSLWDGKKQMSYYDHQKLVEDVLVKSNQMKPEAAKEQRVKNIRNFVKTYDDQFGKKLSERYTLLETSALRQNYALSGAKPAIFFKSFFRSIEFLKRNGIRYSIALRSFGDDIETAIEIIERELSTQDEPVVFERGQFARNILLMYEDGVRFSDKGPQLLKDAKSAEEVAAAIAFMEEHGQIKEKLSDYSDIQKRLTETKYIAVRDYHPPWAKDELWFQGKKFFFPSKDSQGQPILPLFFDDNIGDPSSDICIVHPIQWNKNLQLWQSVHPRELINNRMFQVITAKALMEINYFAELIETALHRYHYNLGEKRKVYQKIGEGQDGERKLEK